MANPDIKTKPSAVPAPFNGPTQATSPEKRGVAMRSPVNDPQVGAGCGGAAGRQSVPIARPQTGGLLSIAG